MRVLFLPEVSQQFLDLAEILYDKGYMGFLDDAVDYSESLFREIQTTLPFKVHREAPSWFDRFGKNMSFASFRKNPHTTWYVFFNVYEVGEESVYLVRYISNNHVIAQHLELEC